MVNLLTTDLLVEDVHFLREAISPFKLGRKSLAVNISDIAAMGGTPGEAVISIAIPETVEIEYLDEFYEGMRSMCREFEVNILGGDTTSSRKHLVINIALTGWIAEDEVLYRSGARPGDVAFLTGTVGSSAAGLDLVLSGRDFEEAGELLEAHYNPVPHVRQGRIIAGLKAATVHDRRLRRRGIGPRPHMQRLGRGRCRRTGQGSRDGCLPEVLLKVQP